MAGELLGVSRPTRSSWGSTSARSTAPSRSASREPSPSLRQQWGRAGRRGPGLAVLVASQDALDQFFMRSRRRCSPGRRGGDPRPREPARARRARPFAAFEGPIDERDAQTLGPEALERAALLPELKRTPAGWVWGGTDYPAARVALRSADRDSFTVVDAETGTVLGPVERARAYSTVHEGAIYLHLGEQHLVRSWISRPSRPSSRAPRRLVHAGEEGDADCDRRAAPQRAAARPRALLRPRLGDRAGRRYQRSR